jgi:hypothetical protein
MGFWEENEGIADGAGSGAYVGKDEKAELIASGQTFPVTAVSVRDNPFEAGGEQYVVTVVLPDEEGEDADRILTFTVGTVDSRDRVLDKMAEWLEDAANDPPTVKLTMVGRSLLVIPADAPDQEEPKAEPKAKAKPAAKPTARRTAAKPTTRGTKK